MTLINTRDVSLFLRCDRSAPWLLFGPSILLLLYFIGVGYSPVAFFGVIGIFLYLIQLSFVVYLRPIVLLFLPILFGFLWQGISVVFLEYGSFAPEIAVDTVATGASIRYFFLQSVFLVGIYIVIPKHKNILPVARLKLSKFVLQSLLFVILILTINGIVYGFPLLDLQQRFFYWENHPFGGSLSKLLSLSSYLLLYVGWHFAIFPSLYSEKIGLSKIFKLTSLMIFAIAILYANKASFFFVSMLSILSGYLLGRYQMGESVLRTLFLFLNKILAFLILILLFVFSFYQFVHGYLPDEALKLIFDRILAMQGQLWWAIDSSSVKPNFSISDLFFKSSADRPYGIYSLMEAVMPSDAFIFYFENKIPLTGGFPANLVFFFGFLISIPVVFVFGLISGFIARGLGFSLIFAKYDYYLWIVLLASLTWALSLGSFNIFTSPLFLLTLFAIFSLKIARLAKPI